MDLLGVFKEKIGFLKIKKYLNPPYTDPATRDPRIGCGLATSSPARGLAPIGCRRRSGGMSCGSARCMQACGRDGSGLATADLGGLATATPACGPPCTKQFPCFISDPRCLTKCPEEKRRRGMTSPAAELHDAWATGQNGITSRNPLGFLGSKGRKTEGGGRRGEVVASVGAATSVQRRCWCPFPLQRRVNARAMACAGKRGRRVNDTARLGVGRRRGIAAGDAAKLGPAPWVAAGKASAVGTSARVRGSSERWQGVHLATKRAVLPPATACAKYPTTMRPWRRGRPKHGDEARRKKKGPKVQPRLRVGVRASWGARWRESVVPARTRARTRTRRCGVANASSTARRTMARRTD
jgi:hypothetical protein